MKKLVIFAIGWIALSGYARDFKYEGLYYTVIDEEAATCKTRAGDYEYMDWDGPHSCEVGNTYQTDNLVIPATVYDSDKTYTVIEIGDQGFYGISRSGSMESVVLPNTIIVIGKFAFSNNIDLRYANIPESVTTIKAAAFGMTKLESIDLPNSVVEIGNSAFNYTYITSIKIPSNIKVLGSNIVGEYRNGLKMESVYYEADELLEANNDVFCEDVYQTATLYVKESALEQARTVQPWYNFVNIEPYEFSGIEEVASDVVSTEYFNLQGQPADQTYMGLVIKVETLANGQKLASKTILK